MTTYVPTVRVTSTSDARGLVVIVGAARPRPVLAPVDTLGARRRAVAAMHRIAAAARAARSPLLLA